MARSRRRSPCFLSASAARAACQPGIPHTPPPACVPELPLYNPEIGVIVTSGRPLHQELPDGCQFWAKPWAPLDVIREAERMVDEKRREEAWPGS